MMNRRAFTALTLTAATSLRAGAAATLENPPDLDAIRKRHDVPAVGGCLVTTDETVWLGAAGIRRRGHTEAVTTADLWHLGSNTKAMTATLLATWVEQGRIQWDQTLEQLLPGLIPDATPAFRSITLRQLLTHRSGLPANAPWHTNPAAADRLRIVQAFSGKPLLSEPGTTTLYSNLGYMTAGVIAERLGRALWEDLITKRVFTPLGMKAGFGGTGTPGQTDQPWPHVEDGKPLPSNGPDTDNRPSLGPAGTCHMSLQNWALFIRDHLRGPNNLPALLKAGTYTALHTPAPGTDHAPGWMTAERPWSGGTCLTHNGSNTMNYSVTWLAPYKKFAVLATVNQSGPAAQKAADQICSALIAGWQPR